MIKADYHRHLPVQDQLFYSNLVQKKLYICTKNNTYDY